MITKGLEKKILRRSRDKNPPGLQEGFCQRKQRFTSGCLLNGRRFQNPRTVKDGKIYLLRLGNLSANVAYWLEACEGQ